MYVNLETVITFGKVVSAFALIAGILIAAYKFYMKPSEVEKNLDILRKEHEEDIRKINEEQCLITYGLLACLKGLQEKGCNGPVTEAIGRMEKHLNKQAHDMEE